jgi:type III pantothenate kinase
MAALQENRLLIVIVGNTQTHVGFHDREAGWRIDRYRTREAPWPHPAPGRPTGIVSVVPEASQALLARWQGEDPLLLSAANAPLPIAYAPPTSMGADRIANAVALHARFGGPAIAVDLGTATSLTVLGADGTILGGAIAPGLDTSHAALIERTAQLPPVELLDPGVPWGRTTTESIQLGLVAGHVGLVRHLVARMREALGPETPVALTGGGARILAPLLPDYHHLPELTLDGGRLWLAHALEGRTK